MHFFRPRNFTKIGKREKSLFPLVSKMVRVRRAKNSHFSHFFQKLLNSPNFALKPKISPRNSSEIPEIILIFCFSETEISKSLLIFCTIFIDRGEFQPKPGETPEFSRNFQVEAENLKFQLKNRRKSSILGVYASARWKTQRKSRPKF